MLREVSHRQRAFWKTLTIIHPRYCYICAGSEGGCLIAKALENGNSTLQVLLNKRRHQACDEWHNCDFHMRRHYGWIVRTLELISMRLLAPLCGVSGARWHICQFAATPLVTGYGTINNSLPWLIYLWLIARISQFSIKLWGNWEEFVCLVLSLIWMPPSYDIKYVLWSRCQGSWLLFDLFATFFLSWSSAGGESNWLRTDFKYCKCALTSNIVGAIGYALAMVCAHLQNLMPISTQKNEKQVVAHLLQIPILRGKLLFVLSICFLTLLVLSHSKCHNPAFRSTLEANNFRLIGPVSATALKLYDLGWVRVRVARCGWIPRQPAWIRSRKQWTVKNFNVYMMFLVDVSSSAMSYKSLFHIFKAPLIGSSVCPQSLP